MSGGKGGSETSSVKIPGYIENASKDNIALAQQIADMGYVPYYGPDVAAATGQQVASWNGANDAASAFGLPTAAVDLPREKQFAGGVSGYSSGGIYDQALRELRSRRPDVYNAMNGLNTGGGRTVTQQASIPRGVVGKPIGSEAYGPTGGTFGGQYRPVVNDSTTRLSPFERQMMGFGR